MNILQIGTMDNKGGAALVSYQLKGKLEEMGHIVNMFTGYKFSKDNNVFTIPRSRFLILLNKVLATDINFFHSNYILKTEQFKNADIIHCHNLHGWYFNLKTLQNISKIKPVVWTLHDMWPITGHCAWAYTGNWEKECNKWQKGCQKCSNLKIYPRLRWDNTKYLFNKKRKIYENLKLNIAVPSLWLKKIIEKSILGNQNIRLIYNGILTKHFQFYDKNETRKKLGLPAAKKIITFISYGGKSNLQKGWRYTKFLVDYYKKNKDILFLCIGGEKDEKINSNNIRYIKYIADKTLLAKYYSSSDIFLLTSLAENFPLTILEAMACGTPIVSFNVGGVMEAVSHKQNSYLAEYKNSKDLINGIEYIFNLNKDEIQKMSLSSVQRVNDFFSLDIMADNYLKFYQEILDNR